MALSKSERAEIESIAENVYDYIENTLFDAKVRNEVMLELTALMVTKCLVDGYNYGISSAGVVLDDIMRRSLRQAESKQPQTRQ